MTPKTRKRVAAVALTAVLAVVFVFACPREPPTPVVVADMWDHWVLLDQPEDAHLVGKGWTLAGSPETTCYVASLPAAPSRSIDRYSVSWSSDASSAGALGVAEAVGAEGAVARTRSGTMSFDSVLIVRAEDVRPVFGRCQDAAGDLLPRRPVITAMIGAAGFELDVGDSVQASIAAEGIRLDPTNANISLEYVDRSRLRVSFGSIRWIGAHLAGFTSGPPDTSYSSHAVLGEISTSDDWNFRAERTGAGIYQVTVMPNVPPITPDLHPEIRDMGVFPVSTSGATGSSGSFVMGRLEMAPGITGYRVMLIQRNYRPVEWTRNSERAALDTWVAQRRNE